MGLFSRSKVATKARGRDDFWALKDLSFDVAEGEVLGIIGHNGAGKTTLLRLLSRITEPTTGGFRIRGRVGSLLEVGTGFHPELTGRENTYLSGAILGMPSREITAKFDEIVAFAGVEPFIDMPVKHYSSGMYLRLAFAVAAHLEPEVLLVDEVLAVGDAAFQKKCLGKMQDVAGTGRTVVFVSHNMAAIANLCTRALWLKAGRTESLGPTQATIDTYLTSMQSGQAASLSDRIDRQGDGPLRLTRFWFSNAAGNVLDTLTSGDEVFANVEYSLGNSAQAPNVTLSVRINDSLGTHLFTLSTHFTEAAAITLRGEGLLRCHIPCLPLTAAAYSVDLHVSSDGKAHDFISAALKFNVAAADVFATGKLPVKQKHGPFIVPHSWHVDNSVASVS